MRDVALKVIEGHIAYLSSRGLPHAALKRAFPRIFSRAERPQEDGWISWEEYAPYTTAFVELVRRERDLADFARFLLTSPGTWLATIGRMLSLFSDGRRLYHLMATQMGRNNFRNLRATSVDRPDGRVELTAELREGSAPCPAYFEILAAGFRVLPNVLGLEDATVEPTIGGTRSVYLIQLPPARTILSRLTRGRAADRELREAYEQVFRSEAELSRLRHELERRVEERTLELAAAKEAAEAANRAKSAFLANLSHELRTPLAAMMGFTDLLAHGGHVDAAGRPHLAAIERNGRHLLTLISDLLDLSLIEEGQLSFHRERIDPLDEIAGVVGTLRPAAEKKGVVLVTRVAPNLPEEVVTDPVRLRQILLNVIGNAVKFTAVGEVAVHVGLTTSSGPLLEVRVADTGPGVPAAARESIFDPFVQADQSLRRRHEGAGLGLALARRLARGLGGDVQLERSEPGRGSRFVVRVAAQ